MGLLTRIKIWISGEKLYASDLNAEFNNILNNLDHTKIEDESTNITAMRALADPYPGGAESLATDSQDEIHRLRYLLKQLTQTTQWYIYPDLVTKTAAYTATLNDKIILCDATAGAFTITLPTAVGNRDKRFIIKKIDSSTNTVTIDGNGAETIDGVATKILQYQYQSIDIISDNANWIIVYNINVNALEDSVVTKTAAYTATLNDKTILCDATTAAFTVTLPTAVGCKGKKFIIKKTDSTINTVTIDGNGAETIDGVATKILTNQYYGVSIISNNTNWIIEQSIFSTNLVASGNILVLSNSVQDITISTTKGELHCFYLHSIWCSSAATQSYTYGVDVTGGELVSPSVHSYIIRTGTVGAESVYLRIVNGHTVNSFTIEYRVYEIILF